MLEQRLITQFLDALQEIPETEASLDLEDPAGAEDGLSSDAQIHMSVAGKPYVLSIQTRKTLFPRDVRQILWKLQAANRQKHVGNVDQPLTVLVAESISQGAKEMLREERVGYYDSGGSLYLPAPGAYVYINMPTPKTMAKSVRTLFSGRRSQVLHTLLAHHESWFGITELARQAMVSPATASKVVAELERFDWLDVRGRGPSKERHLREPSALLDAWTRELPILRRPPIHRYYVPGLNSESLLARIGQVFDAHEVQYAVSHEAAAQYYAPFLTKVAHIRLRVLISANALAATDDMGAQGVDEGSNLGVIEAQSPGEMLFREKLDGLWLASPIQIYLDLLSGEGRSKEMARHFRKEKIGF